MSSRDFVTLFRGGAGTGKSFTLREVKAGLIQAGHTVQVLAPQRQQVADLERDGFSGAQTVSTLLKQRFLTRGTVVLVDEAGQIGGQQMLELLSLIQTARGRVILSGDTHQHDSERRGAGLSRITKQVCSAKNESLRCPGTHCPRACALKLNYHRNGNGDLKSGSKVAA